MDPKMVEKLKKMAETRVWADSLNNEQDVIVDDYAGGNIDDAYYGGYDSGETQLARIVLMSLGIAFTIKAE